MKTLLQHVVGHHIYTNVFGADPDLPETTTGDLRRLVHRQRWSSLYKYQHIYMPPLYGLLGLKVTDFSTAAECLSCPRGAEGSKCFEQRF